MKRKTFLALFLMTLVLLLFSSWEANSKPLLVPRWKLSRLPIVRSACRLDGETLRLSGQVWNDTELAIGSVTIWFRMYSSRKKQVISSEQQLLLRLKPGGYRSFDTTVPLQTKLDRPLSSNYYNVSIIGAKIDDSGSN